MRGKNNHKQLQLRRNGARVLGINSPVAQISRVHSSSYREVYLYFKMAQL